MSSFKEGVPIVGVAESEITSMFAKEPVHVFPGRNFALILNMEHRSALPRALRDHKL